MGFKGWGLRVWEEIELGTWGWRGKQNKFEGFRSEVLGGGPGVLLQKVAPTVPQDLQAYFHGFQEVV